MRRCLDAPSAAAQRGSAGGAFPRTHAGCGEPRCATGEELLEKKTGDCLVRCFSVHLMLQDRELYPSCCQSFTPTFLLICACLKMFMLFITQLLHTINRCHCEIVTNFNFLRLISVHSIAPVDCLFKGFGKLHGDNGATNRG